MLRASGLATDTDIDFSLISEGGDSLISESAESSPELGAIPHADLLTRFVDAVVEQSDQLSELRDELSQATDEATMIDASAVIAAFEMMTRIADGTGTTHPASRIADLEAVRDELGLDHFESARVLSS